MLVIQYFRYCAMSSVSWYFFMSRCMLSLHLFFVRPLLLLPETSRLSDFAQMWLRFRLKQRPNHVSLLSFVCWHYEHYWTPQFNTKGFKAGRHQTLTLLLYPGLGPATEKIISAGGVIQPTGIVYDFFLKNLLDR